MVVPEGATYPVRVDATLDSHLNTLAVVSQVVAGDTALRGFALCGWLLSL